MAEDIKALIEKINQEGIQVAEEKARHIEQEAKENAEQLIKGAKSRAQEIIAKADAEAKLAEEKGRVLLKQAGRDLLLLVKNEINSMLDKLIVQEVKHALSAESLAHILNSIIHDICKHQKAEIVIALSKEDAARVKEGFLGKLKEELKKQIVLKSSDEIRAGFVISFDAGKSQFDFSEKALAEYISTFVKPRLKEILE